MIIVIILRWLFGYIEFNVTGKFPERFLNLANKKGIKLWQLKSNSEGFCAKAGNSDFTDLQYVAEKTQTVIHINKKYGLPVLIEKYRHRAGLIMGAVLFLIICNYLSGFIWNVNITVPDTINEYEIREELKKLGLYEGVKSDSLDINKIERTITINNPEISWITVNVMGTDADIIITPNLSVDIDKNSEKIIASNIKSSEYGTVTRMEVKNGTAMVKVGEGITKDQLLVSGIIEYSDGSSILVDSNAEIYAAISKKTEIEVPLKLQTAEKTDSFIEKIDIDILGIKIPLTLHPNPNGSYFKSIQKSKLSLAENEIPITITAEKWYKYNISESTLSLETAKTIALNRLKLYEIFLLYSSNNGTFLKKNYIVNKFSDKIVLSADYVFEMDICKKSIIQIEN